MTKNIKSINKTYFVLMFLTVLCMTRFVFYKREADVSKNYTSEGYITNPIIIDKGQFVLKTDKYTIYTFSGGSFTLGDKIKFTGSKYFNNVYAKNVKKLDSPFYIILLYKIKVLLIKSISSIFLEPFSSIILGMLYGIQPNFTEEFSSILVRAGVVHVLVVSGFNISILFSFIGKLLSRYSLIIRLFISILISILYSLITGFEPPIVRALIFGIILSSGKTLGYKSNVMYILLLVGILMVIVSPDILLSVSFQLSFLATLGIVLLNPYLGLFIDRKFKIIPNELRESFKSSFSAQFLVFPILLYYFKGFSLVSVVTNTLILWMVPIIMSLGFIYSLFYILGLGFLMSHISIVLYLPLIFFVDFVNFMANIPYSNITYQIELKYLPILYLGLFIIYFLLTRILKLEDKNAQNS